MNIIVLFLALNLDGTRVMENRVDNVSFKTIQQCEQYKKAMNYRNTEHLTFICKKGK